jgi:hypothetical protein
MKTSFTSPKLPLAIVMPMAHGKTTLANKFPNLFADIDKLVPSLKSPQAKAMRRRALKSGDWSQVNSEMLAAVRSLAPYLQGRTLLIHTAYPELSGTLDMSYIAPMPWQVIRDRIRDRQPGDGQALQLGKTNYDSHLAAINSYPLPVVRIDHGNGQVSAALPPI